MDRGLADKRPLLVGAGLLELDRDIAANVSLALGWQRNRARHVRGGPLRASVGRHDGSELVSPVAAGGSLGLAASEGGQVDVDLAGEDAGVRALDLGQLALTCLASGLEKRTYEASDDVPYKFPVLLVGSRAVGRERRANRHCVSLFLS